MLYEVITLKEAKRRADAAGHLRYALPTEFGGQNGSNLGMAVIREHFAKKGLGLVITSYSIHYTKLYDFGWPHWPLSEAFGMAEIG